MLSPNGYRYAFTPRALGQIARMLPGTPVTYQHDGPRIGSVRSAQLRDGAVHAELSVTPTAGAYARAQGRQACSLLLSFRRNLNRGPRIRDVDAIDHVALVREGRCRAARVIETT